MTFDQALENYQTLRTELRCMQGTIDKMANDYKKLGKSILQQRKAYKSKHRAFLDAVAALKPELDKEITGSSLAVPADVATEVIELENND